ncbi:hypothetical protein BGZ73_005528 [Actinomortierella ambigua]|nr:hypothetical protein BGZ73_005528 [Actinomortierella ambigua]
MSQQQQQQQQQKQQQQHPPQDPHQAGTWPRLLAFREVATAVIADKLNEARPLRDKLNKRATRLWQRYVELVYKKPLLTTFITSLILFSAGPIVVCACVLGMSMGFLVGTAAVVILIIQSIIASIAGAILLMVLGSIFVVTTFLFFWIFVAVVAHRLTTRLLLRVRESAKPAGPQLGYEDGHSTVQHSPSGNSSRGSFEDLDTHEEDERHEEEEEKRRRVQQKESQMTGTGNLDSTGPAVAPDGSRDAVVPNEP